MAKVKIIDRQVSGLPTIEWARGKPTVIVAHDVGNDNSTIEGEISFMADNYENAFFHYIAGEDGLYMVHDPDIGGAWGAGPSMHNYAIHVEFIHSDTKKGFQEAYNNYVNGIRYLADKYGIPVKVNKGTDKRGIYTHHYVSNTFGGTNHVDPDDYLARYGVSINQFAKDLGDSKGDAEVSKPSTPSKPTGSSGNLGLVDWMESQGMDSSYSNREKLAKQYGIKGYTGSASQNETLLSKLKSGASNSGGGGSVKVGNKVTLSKSAKTYATGESIPASVKGKQYTVQQVKSDRVLLKEIYSWARKSDVTGGAGGAGGSSGSSSGSKSGKEGKLKITSNSGTAYVMDKPDRNNSRNLGTVSGTVPLNGSVRGKNSSSGYWEIEYNGGLGYVTGKYGKQA